MARGKLWIAALASGVLAGFSQPLVIASVSPEPLDPTGLSGLIAFVALVPLLVALHGSSARRAFWFGLVASTVQIVIIAHWVVFAFEVAGVPPIAGIVPMLICGAALGAITALGFWSAMRIHLRFGWPLGLIFPVTLTAAEFARNYLPFGGDPWGTIGMSMASLELLRQGAALVGVYGLVFFVALINGAIAEAWVSRKLTKRSAPAALVFAGWVVFSLFWRSSAPPPAAPIKVAILQASIPQVLINDPNARADQMIAPYHQLQSEALAQGAELIVWPETALLPAVPANAIMLPSVVSSTSAPAPKAAIIGGAAIHQSSGLTFVYNSAFVLGPDLAVRGRFDKLHLVPFGEYVPWPFGALLKRMVTVQYELLPGESEKTVPVVIGGRTIPVGVTICWDGVFPEVSRRFAQNGAELMFNLTNDGWYGISSEPYQHLLMYQMRATETARPVARAANTGISAVIDARGRITARAGLGEKTALIAEMSPSKESTPYLFVGDSLAWAAIAASLLGLAATFKNPRL